MKRFLAIGSSQLAGFIKGVDRFDESLAGRFHFAGMWEPGFGYLNLESDGSICAPDLVPARNNPKKRNLKLAWKISDSDQLPCIHDYQKIFVVASPCKYFAPFYYAKESTPFLLSSSLLESCFYSWQIDKQFVDISRWHFRVTPIIRQLISAFPEKVVFIGAPLPLENLETQYFECLRAMMNSKKSLIDVHFQNIESIRSLCGRLHASSECSYDVILPPDKLLCDLKLTTRSIYSTKNSVFHAGSEYWREIVAQVNDLYLA